MEATIVLLVLVAYIGVVPFGVLPLSALASATRPANKLGARGTCLAKPLFS